MIYPRHRPCVGSTEVSGTHFRGHYYSVRTLAGGEEESKCECVQVSMRD